MKKLIAILLLLVLVTSLAACGKNDDGVPEGMKDVAVENAAFYLYVPELWLSQSQGGISGAMSPRGNANIIATVYLPETGYLDAQEYWTKKCLADYTAEFSEFTVIEAECKATTLGGMNAYQAVFTRKSAGQTYQQLQVIALQGGMIYTVQYTAVAGEAYNEWITNGDVANVIANFTLC